MNFEYNPGDDRENIKLNKTLIIILIPPSEFEKIMNKSLREMQVKNIDIAMESIRKRCEYLDLIDYVLPIYELESDNVTFEILRNSQSYFAR